MPETTKEAAQRVVYNDLTWPRVVMVKYLTSFFRHSPYFDWKEDFKKTSIAVLDSRSELSDLNEKSDRVIVLRQAFNGSNIVTDNRTEVNNNMYTHKIVKPRLGYLNIFCESRNDVQSEYIATQIENVLMLHKEELMEKNVLISTPQMSDVKNPVSGTGFFSMVITVPTHVAGRAEFSIDKPQMLNDIEMEWAIEAPA